MRSNKKEESKVIEFSTVETSCVYLPEKRMRMHYKYIKNASKKLNSDLTERGWRRFGEYYSRPACKDCNECLSLKIDAFNFKFSKSAKRVMKKNANTKIHIQTPTTTTAHIKLYEKYHLYMSKKKGWKYYPISPALYNELYVQGHGEFGIEILYFIDGKLVGVDLVDICENGISSIYFFYDPDYSQYSLGRYSIYQQILMAQKYSLRWIYLGYYVKDCNSLNYKASYKPHKILVGSPSLKENPIWIDLPEDKIPSQKRT